MFGREARTFDGVDYAPGRKFRVVKAGLRLSGWQPRSGYHQGWGQDLKPGDVIECTGYGPGWGSDPGYGVQWTSEEAQAAHAYSLDIWPQVGGLWAYRPPTGHLVPIDDQE